MRLDLGRYPTAWLALAAAALGAVIAPLLPGPHTQPDSIAFEAIARSILAGHGIRYQEAHMPGLDLFAFRAPGYPVFLAGVYAFAGATTVLVLQGALNGISAALVGAIAGHLAGPRAAWIAFALRLAWPAAWLHATVLESEILYEFLTVLATWLVVVAVRERRSRFALLAGVVTAAAILVRPVGLGLAGALGLWLLFQHQRAVVPFAAACVLAWAPWPVRNALVLHAFVPFTTNGGATAWAGTTDLDVTPAYEWMGANLDRGEVGFDRQFREWTAERIREHPGHVARMTAVRAFVYLGPIRGREAELWVHRFALCGALAGLAYAASRRQLVLPGLVWLAQGALLVPIYLIARYRFPTEWCVIVAAAIGWIGLARALGARRAGLVAGVALALSLVGSFALALF